MPSAKLDKPYKNHFSLDEVHYMRETYMAPYNGLDNLEEYFRAKKVTTLKEHEHLITDDVESKIFSDFTLSPADMEFEVVPADTNGLRSLFYSIGHATSTRMMDTSVPGRELKLLIFEKTTNKVVGIIRVGSPAINMKPRNVVFGVRNYSTDIGLKLFNKHAYAGQIIIPTQPVGYNYAFGKLLTLLCVSNEVRGIFDKKYDTELCYFETTSYYGSLKPQSQYDGLKPFIRRSNVITESKLTPMLPKHAYRELRDFVQGRFGHELLDAKIESVSSRKMKNQKRIESIIFETYKEYGELDTAEEWKVWLNDLREMMTTQKNYYYSFCGYQNAVPYLTKQDSELLKSDNHERWSQGELTEWWRKKAINRFERLKSEGRLRTKLEILTDRDTLDNIDIVR